MLYNVRKINELAVAATDGNIGTVRDMLFADDSWQVRYLLVDTGGWLSGEEVLLSPAVFTKLDWDSRELSVTLTREQVESSPEIDSDRPISQQHLRTLHDEYGCPPYPMVTSFGWGVSPVGPAVLLCDPRAKHVREESAAAGEDSDDPHLRSANEVRGYRIQALDGEIGHVEDFIMDDGDWEIKYLVIDTRNWLPGRKVLVAPAWIAAVKWPASTVDVDLQREQIQSAPEYDPGQPLTEDYQNDLYKHYGKVRLTE